MQYLLDGTEMAQITAERKAAEQLPGREIGACLQLLGDECKRIATTMHVLGSGEPRAHGCIHVQNVRGQTWQVRYCDRCPVQKICPLPKAWSK